MSQLYEFRLCAWHIYRWNAIRKAWRGCAGHLSRLYFASAADLQRSRLWRNVQPSANPDELAAAVIDCIDAGARVINLSLALARNSTGAERPLKSALDRAMLRGVIVIAAAGNQNTVGSGVITSHPWVIPITACDREGFPSAYSNAGLSIGGRGLRAPGDGVISSGAHGASISSCGTSVAAPFATGTVALLWSIFPAATAQEMKLALTQAPVRRTSIVPPLLNAWTAYQTLAMRYR